MDPRSELEQILADLFDQAPDEARAQKLRDLLKAHPELQEVYVEQMQLHALLQWRGGKAGPPDTRPAEVSKATPASRSIWSSRGALTAALIFTVASIALVIFLMLPGSPRTPDQLFERLINLNLELAQTPALHDRDRLFAEHVEDLKVELARANLSDDDRLVAHQLIDASDWLTKNDDPMAKAERFNDLADRLVDRFDVLTATGGIAQVERFADTYRRLAILGVEANQEQALAAGNLDRDQKKKLAWLQQRDEARATKLEQIIAHKPEPMRKAFHRGMKGHSFKKGKK